MVLLDLPLSREYFLSIFQTRQVRPDIAERTSDMSVARSLVANGFGFGLVNLRSGSDLAPDGKRLAFLPLSDDVRPMVLGIGTKRSAFRSRIVGAFFDHVRALVANEGLPGTPRS
jgi:DNA-binding transcriptional LysR family regulator